MTDVFRKFLTRGATVVNSGMFETALFEDPKNHAIQNWDFKYLLLTDPAEFKYPCYFLYNLKYFGTKKLTAL